MIPKTLDETVPALDALLSFDDRASIQGAGNVNDIIASLHHSLGRHLRNTWGLWQGSDLALHLTEHYGIEHPDDMSHLIIENYARAWLKTRAQRLLEDTDPFKDEAES